MESTSLTTLAEEQLAKAREGSAGRSAVTVHGGRDFVMRQTLMALLGGQGLAAHECMTLTTNSRNYWMRRKLSFRIGRRRTRIKNWVKCRPTRTTLCVRSVPIG